MKAERPENHTNISSGGLLGGPWGAPGPQEAFPCSRGCFFEVSEAISAAIGHEAWKCNVFGPLFVEMWVAFWLCFLACSVCRRRCYFAVFVCRVLVMCPLVVCRCLLCAEKAGTQNILQNPMEFNVFFQVGEGGRASRRRPITT